MKEKHSCDTPLRPVDRPLRLVWRYQGRDPTGTAQEPSQDTVHTARILRFPRCHRGQILSCADSRGGQQVNGRGERFSHT